MMRTLRSALVIARRDYIATVWSKTFLIFLIGPVLPLLLGVMMAWLSSGEDQAGPRRDAVAVTMPAGDAAAVVKARDRLAARLGGDEMPLLARTTPRPEQA